jgi:uncharacterized integral membrane protein (TIGR00698 family)
MFLYPLLHALDASGMFFPESARAFGLYAGSTIHEVAQVVAAAHAVSAQAADEAVIAKMLRVLMLAPFLLAVSAWLSRKEPDAGAAGPARIAVPWFAVAFIAVVLFNSLQWVPAAASQDIGALDTFLLATAMAALGISTRVTAIRQAGGRPLVLAVVLFAWLVIGGAAINRGIEALLPEPGLDADRHLAVVEDLQLRDAHAHAQHAR